MDALGGGQFRPLSFEIGVLDLLSGGIDTKYRYFAAIKAEFGNYFTFYGQETSPSSLGRSGPLHLPANMTLQIRRKPW